MHKVLSLKPHLFSLTQRKFIESVKLPSHVSYMFRLVIPSSGMSAQEYVQQDAEENEGVPSYIYCLRMAWVHAETGCMLVLAVWSNVLVLY
jgi:hypothetical protein